MRQGAVKNAIVKLKPSNKIGPWHILCDNEGFLNSKEAKQLYFRGRLKMWHVPSRSPDLNPVERVWAWLRKHLRAMDLKDAVAKKPVLTKAAYKERIRRVCMSRKCQAVAGNCAKSFRRTCRRVVDAGGAAVKG